MKFFYPLFMAVMVTSFSFAQIGQRVNPAAGPQAPIVCTALTGIPLDLRGVLSRLRARGSPLYRSLLAESPEASERGDSLLRADFE